MFPDLETILKEKLKDLVRAVWRNGVYRRVLFALDALALRTARTPTDQPPYTLLVAPATGANLGDQAMFESCVANTPGNIVAVVTSPNFRIPSKHDGEVKVVHLQGLIHRPPFVRFASVRRYASLVRAAVRVVGPGADMLDGGHTHASLARFSLFRIAAVADKDTIIQGFSWKAEAPDTVRVAARDLAPRAQLTPRDPVSDRRLKESDVVPTVSAADTVFSYPADEPLYDELESFVSRAEADGAPLILLNTSGLIARKVDLIPDYRFLVESIHELGARVVIVPHVIRRPDNDLAVARAVKALDVCSEDFQVDRLLRPGQVRRLASSAVLTLTGRMHFAIMTLSTSTPAVCLATAGKVEGLFELFDLDDHVVSPEPGCGDELARLTSTVLADPERFRMHVGNRLPRVRELSALNFPYAHPPIVA